MPFMTPTHAFNVLRVRAADTRTAESHEGTTDVLFVVSGNGRVTVGGRIESGAPLPGMPGEIRGKSISGGQSYALTPNAVINIPPSTPYLVQAESGPDDRAAENQWACTLVHRLDPTDDARATPTPGW
jgi:hypothetical protein